jgi:uncharacterized protein YifN (PemK superfamily)
VLKVQPRRRRSNKIRKSQKKGNPNLITPLSTTTQVEEVKDSPIQRDQKNPKGRHPKERQQPQKRSHFN